MTQLIFLIAFISAEKRKFTQTLNVGVNLASTEELYVWVAIQSGTKLQCHSSIYRCFKTELHPRVRVISRTKPNQKSIELSGTQSARLICDWFRNRSNIIELELWADFDNGT